MNVCITISHSFLKYSCNIFSCEDFSHIKQGCTSFDLSYFLYTFDLSQILIKFKYFNMLICFNLLLWISHSLQHVGSDISRNSLKYLTTLLKILCLTFRFFGASLKLAYTVISTGSHISLIHMVCHKDVNYLINTSNIPVKQYMSHFSSIFHYLGFLFLRHYYFSGMSPVDYDKIWEITKVT